MSKYSIQFPEKFDKELKSLEKKESKDRYDMIDLALKTYLYLKDQIEEGNKVAITNMDGQIINFVEIP